MVTYSSNTIRRRASGLWVLVAVVVVGLAALVGGGARSALATGCTFNLSSATYSGPETTQIPITINRTGGTCANTLRITLTDVSAHAGTSYQNPSPIDLPFLVADSSRTFNVQTLDDTIVGNTTLTATLTFQPGGANGDVIGVTNVATVTILDNDGPPIFSFSQSNYNVAENAGSITITVNRAGLLNMNAVNVKYNTVDGSAIAPSDYTAIGLTQLNFSIGQSTATFNVVIINDLITEPNQLLSLHLSAPSNSGGVAADATVTIIDDDGPGTVQFSNTAPSVSEAAGAANVAVTRIGGSTGAISAVCSDVGGGTATPGGVDYTYTPSPQTLNWADGDSSTRFCVVTITQDIVVEGPETVNLQIAGAQVVFPAAATLTINDDDGTGALAFQSATYSAAENGGNAVITLVRTGGTTGGISADCTTLAGGSATANVDYTAGSFTATFASGVTIATCSIPIIDDALVEGPETVALGLTNFTGGAVAGVQNTATLTVADNETAGPVVTLVSPSFGLLLVRQL
jgi:Calx-beta domain